MRQKIDECKSETKCDMQETNRFSDWQLKQFFFKFHSLESGLRTVMCRQLALVYAR